MQMRKDLEERFKRYQTLIATAVIQSCFHERILGGFRMLNDIVPSPFIPSHDALRCYS